MSSKQTIIHGDCLVELPKLAAVSVDVVVTSPPYNIGVAYGQHDDRQPRDAYLANLAECFTKLHHVMKPTGSFFLNIGIGTADDMTSPFAIIERALAAGFVLQNRVCWIKSITVDGVIRGHCKPVNSSRYLTRMFEEIFHFTKNGDVQLNKLAIGVPYADKSNIARRGHAQDLRDRGNAWFIDYDTVQSKTDKFNHPAGFPVELPTWCIKLHGVRSNLIVLDPYLGTGSTLVAAQQLGVHGIGVEIDRQYVETARKRLGAAPVAPEATAAPATPTHSRIGPSRSELIMHCAGSVQAEDAAGRPPAGEAAEGGSELHAIAEECLRTGTKSTDPVIAAYIDEVRATAMRAGVEPLVEVRFDLSKYHPELFGTADAIVVDLAWGVLTVHDFKSGLHHVPADSSQLKLYGGMAFLSLPAAEQRRIKFIDTCVVQPNGSTDPVRRARHMVADILNTLSNYVEIAHVATDDPDPPRTAGPWCRAHFRAARNVCPAFRALAVRAAQAEFTDATEENEAA